MNEEKQLTIIGAFVLAGKEMFWSIKVFSFVRYVILDTYKWIFGKKVFNEYGLTMFCGRQGSGKTMGMTDYLERMRKRYPNCLIYTNYNYEHQTAAMESWRDLLTIRNNTDGVIFAIDELQNEYNSNNYKDFPETILSTVTMQRKQRIKIVATSQVFTRVVKQLREQCYEVVECRTFWGRWTFLSAFDADDYNQAIDSSPDAKLDVKKVWRHNFVQSDEIRNLYDTYKVIEQMKNKEFIPRAERISA